MIFKKKHKKDWYNPNPESVGEIISETKADSGRKKAIIVKHHQGTYYMYGYLIDDSDFVAGFDDTVGWVSDGPSITNTIENAQKLAEEFLSDSR